MSVAMIESLLFSPFRLRAINFPNRIVIAPMQMYKAAPDGLATDWHFQHLAKYAIGGGGTVMTEALIVDPIGRNTYGDRGIWSDEHVAPLQSGGSSATMLMKSTRSRRGVDAAAVPIEQQRQCSSP
jgi:2,4-dienoyl-CoA reductase-like NADH-dependent reductase (Old Yellow Enzyme family)